MFFGHAVTGAAAQGTLQTQQFECTTGRQAYTQANIGVTNLIGATMLQVYYDGKQLQTVVGTPDYTFDSTTGILTFAITVNTGVPASIEYQTA